MSHAAVGDVGGDSNTASEGEGGGGGLSTCIVEPVTPVSVGRVGSGSGDSETPPPNRWMGDVVAA